MKVVRLGLRLAPSLCDACDPAQTMTTSHHYYLLPTICNAALSAGLLLLSVSLCLFVWLGRARSELQQSSSKIFGEGSVKNLVGNLFQLSTTLGLDQAAHHKLIGYTTTCNLRCCLSGQQLGNTDPISSGPPKNLRRIFVATLGQSRPTPHDSQSQHSGPLTWLAASQSVQLYTLLTHFFYTYFKPTV